MIFQESKIKGPYIISPELKNDKRGFFARTFCVNEFKDNGIKFQIVQANISLTKKMGTVRGMHFQKSPKAEAKIIQCLKGKVFDVIIDLRKNSPTKYQWHGEIISEENKKIIYIPKGFAHGFQTLTNNCELMYFMDEFYSPKHATGVRWNDPFFSIKWPLKKALLSPKDETWLLVKPERK